MGPATLLDSICPQKCLCVCVGCTYGKVKGSGYFAANTLIIVKHDYAYDQHTGQFYTSPQLGT